VGVANGEDGCDEDGGAPLDHPAVVRWPWGRMSASPRRMARARLCQVLASSSTSPAAVPGGPILLALAAAPPLLAPGAKPCRVILVQQRDPHDAWTVTGREAPDRCPTPAGELRARVRRRIEQRAGKGSDRQQAG